MRIINQRCDTSLNFDFTSVFLDAECIYTTIDDKKLILGRYASAERAQEVFKDIHLSYALNVIYYMPEK